MQRALLTVLLVLASIGAVVFWRSRPVPQEQRPLPVGEPLAPGVEGAAVEPVAPLGDPQAGGRAREQPEPAAGRAETAETPAPARMDVLSGLALTPEGTAAVGARVTVSRPAAGDYRVLDGGHAQASVVLGDVQADSSGAFEIPVPRDVPLRITCALKDCARWNRAPLFGGEHVLVQLDRGAHVSGFVTARESGRPIEGVDVQAWEREGGTLAARAESGADGSYLLEDLPAGVYTFQLQSAEHASPPSTTVDLATGERRSQDFELESGWVVRGTVRAEDTGRGLAGAQVSTGWIGGKVVTCDELGEYELRGVATARLYARAPGYGGAIQEVAAGSDGQGPLQVDIALPPGRRVTGRILGPDGAPFADAYVAAVSKNAGPNGKRIDWKASRSGADGFFLVTSLSQQGNHVLFVQSAGYGTCLRDLPPDEPLFDEVDVGDVVLTPGGAVSGRIETDRGEPLPGLVISLEGHDRRRNELWPVAHDEFAPSELLFRHSRSDADGRFHFADLAPGDYVVHARANRDTPSQYLPVQIDGGEEVRDLVVRLDVGDAIRGRVVSQEGEGLPMVEVRALEAGSAASHLSTTSGADGEFRFLGVAGGPYRIVARPSYLNLGRPQPLAWTELPGVLPGEHRVELVLPSADTIEGTVLDAAGVRRPGVYVTAHRGDDLVDRTRTDLRGEFLLRVPPDTVLEVAVERGGGAQGPPVQTASGSRGVQVIEPE